MPKGIPGDSLICANCGYGGEDTHWQSYVCPASGCGTLNDRLYRLEHRDPIYARSLTIAQIEDEYRVADRPLRPVRLSVADLAFYRRGTLPCAG